MHQRFEPNSASSRLMEMSYFLSPYPLRYVCYLDGKVGTNRQICLRMRDAGYLAKEKLNTKPYVTLGKAASFEPFEGADKWYRATRKMYTHYPSAKKRNMNIRRADGLALAAMAMMGAGAAVLPSEKPVFGLRADKTGRYYFHAREIKGGSQLIGERQSRVSGALINGTDIYHVFSEKKRACVLPKAAEFKQWQVTLHQAEAMFGPQVRTRRKAAIVLSELDSFPESILGVSRVVSNYSMFDDLFFFNVRTNKELLKMFLDGELDEPLFPENRRKEAGAFMADYRIGSDYCFEYFKPNVARLKKFLTGLEIRKGHLNGRGVIYCFDFQKEQIDQAVGSLAEIRTLTLEEYGQCVNG